MGFGAGAGLGAGAACGLGAGLFAILEPLSASASEGTLNHLHEVLLLLLRHALLTAAHLTKHILHAPELSWLRLIPRICHELGIPRIRLCHLLRGASLIGSHCCLLGWGHWLHGRGLHERIVSALLRLLRASGNVLHESRLT